MHGKYDENLLIEGDDEVLLSDVASRYATAAGGTPATKETARLVHRTAYQMAVTYSLINAYTELYPENSIIVEGIRRTTRSLRWALKTCSSRFRNLDVPCFPTQIQIII